MGPDEIVGSPSPVEVLRLPAQLLLRSGARAQQVGVLASSWNADDDDKAWFGEQWSRLVDRRLLSFKLIGAW
jgi:hypothetical protein